MEIAWNFASYLTLGTLACGALAALDQLILKPRRLVSSEAKTPWVIQEVRSFFPVLLIVLLFRSFLLEPFRIPSGSMKPGLLEGDFILVNKYAYGLRLPLGGAKIVSLGALHRGDVVVFQGPFNPSQNFIKRVVGLPGDVIEYKDSTLFVNGEPQEQQTLGVDYDLELSGQSWTVERKTEDLLGLIHEIFVRENSPHMTLPATTVPEGHYFMVGDNRDNSRDSRYWGFVADRYIIGKAFFIWMSWDPIDKKIRFNRIGRAIR